MPHQPIGAPAHLDHSGTTPDPPTREQNFAALSTRARAPALTRHRGLAQPHENSFASVRVPMPTLAPPFACPALERCQRSVLKRHGLGGSLAARAGGGARCFFIRFGLAPAVRYGWAIKGALVSYPWCGAVCPVEGEINTIDCLAPTGVVQFAKHGLPEANVWQFSSRGISANMIAMAGGRKGRFRLRP